MACPHVSGVVALGVSYAAQLRRHFKATELQQLLVDTATPIDEYCVGKKDYRRYVVDIGPIQPMQINLADYRGGMGSGQINATAFLEAIAGAGSRMHFPNLYISEGAEVAVAPSRYFEQGESLTYEVSIADGDVARCTKSGAKLLFKGLSSGSTSALIKASNGEQHAFNITVRRTATENGWL